MLRNSSLPALLFALFALAASTAHASDAVRCDAKPGDLSMKLTIIGKQTITAYEPVVLRQELTNTANHEVWQSVQPEWTNRVEITDSSGKVVFLTPLQPVPARFCVGIQTYAPKQSHTYCLIISALYTFKDPGTYTIKISEGMTKLDGSAFDAVSTASTSVKVLPFDEAKLDARCQEICNMLTTGKTTPADDQIPPASRSRVFYSIRHDVVLPYLAKYPGSDEVRAMRRIGTEKAMELVKTLTDSNKEGTEGARQGLDMPLKIGSWDWHT